MNPLNMKHYRFDRQLNHNDAVENWSEDVAGSRVSLWIILAVGFLLLVY